MSTNPATPVPVTVVPDARPAEVVIISHSPLFYWWPVWAVGFLMAAVTFWQGHRVAFVPPGTVAERNVQVEGQQGKRDILIAPEGQPLPAESDTEELKQPRMRMAISNGPGMIWFVTLMLVIIVTHVKMRGAWSLVAVMLIGVLTVLFAVFGIWDVIFRVLGFIDIHINAL